MPDRLCVVSTPPRPLNTEEAVVVGPTADVVVVVEDGKPNIPVLPVEAPVIIIKFITGNK